MNAPKISDPSKLLSGTVAKGSTMLGFVGGALVDLVSGWMTGSGEEKRSTVEETGGEMVG